MLLSRTVLRAGRMPSLRGALDPQYVVAEEAGEQHEAAELWAVEEEDVVQQLCERAPVDSHRLERVLGLWVAVAAVLSKQEEEAAEEKEQR